MNSKRFAIDQIAGRKRVHLRRIECEAYMREDGLFDVEATLRDTKPFPFSSAERNIAPDEPIHQMTLRLTIDRQFEILDVKALTLHSPFRICGDIAPDYAQLIGLRIGPGFTQKVKKMFRGPLGCTHLTELLPTLATTAFQALWAHRDAFESSETAAVEGEPSSPLGGCHALRIDGEIARRHEACATSAKARDIDDELKRK